MTILYLICAGIVFLLLTANTGSSNEVDDENFETSKNVKNQRKRIYLHILKKKWIIISWKSGRRSLCEKEDLRHGVLKKNQLIVES